MGTFRTRIDLADDLIGRDGQSVRQLADSSASQGLVYSTTMPGVLMSTINTVSPP